MTDEVATAQPYKLIPLEQIKITGNNPRTIDMKGQAFLQLAQSIKAQGVIVPVHVRQTDDKKHPFELLAGERRFRASRAVEMAVIPAIDHGTLTDEQAFEITFTENYAREDLTALEEGKAAATLLEKYKGDAVAAGAKLGKSETWIRTRAKIHGGLSKTWQKRIAGSDHWTVAHLVEIARLPHETQDELGQNFWGSPSVADIKRAIGDMTRTLRNAPFDTSDCQKCQKRSSCQPGLWDDGSPEKAAKNDRCLDPVCWSKKDIEHLTRDVKDKRQEYPGLVFVESLSGSCKIDHDIKKQIFGSWYYHWDWKKSKKADKDAVPAMVINTVKRPIIYVKVSANTVGGRTAGPKTLKQRHEQLERRRWTEVGKRFAKTLRALPYDEIQEPRISRVLLLGANYGTRGAMGYDIAGQKAKKALDTIVSKLSKPDKGKKAAKETTPFDDEATSRILWEQRIQYGVPFWTEGNENGIREAAAIFGLMGTVDELYETISQSKGFTVPKSWANLNADGTPKKKDEKSAKKDK